MYICFCTDLSDKDDAPLEQAIAIARHNDPDLILKAPDSVKHHTRATCHVLRSCGKQLCNFCVTDKSTQEYVMAVVRRSNMHPMHTQIEPFTP